MPSVLLRVDGSSQIGWGHLMRCVALAQEFRQKGVTPVFVLKYYDENVLERAADMGFGLERIDRRIDFSEDAVAVSKIAKKYNAKIVIADLSHPVTVADIKGFARHLKELKIRGHYVVVIDGGLPHDCICAREEIDADIAVIPYFDSAKGVYKLGAGTKALLGPSYFIFRQEFVRQAMRKEPIRGNVESILLTMGGGDPLELTPKVIEILMKMNKSSLSLRVVQGAGFSPATKLKIEQLQGKWDGTYTVSNGSSRMADLMESCDVAIINSGLTQYETALMGVPSLAVSPQDFSETASLISRIEELVNNAAFRQELAQKGKMQLDGNGVKRVIAEIPKELLS